ncbi:MAG: hypothetical protein L0Y57_13520, partial [Beijerinckiaceae bacterium]|nr:hypothetical protein [Beijerinckiaceae bacterium]
AGVEARCLEPLEELVGSFEMDRDPPAARFRAAKTRAAAAFLALTSDARFVIFPLFVPGCFGCLALAGFVVFLTDAITSALLLPSPLWRRGGI